MHIKTFLITIAEFNSESSLVIIHSFLSSEMHGRKCIFKLLSFDASNSIVLFFNTPYHIESVLRIYLYASSLVLWITEECVMRLAA